MTRYDREVPKGSLAYTTVCQFCAVGCGYRALLVPAENTKTNKGDSLLLAPAFITSSMRNSIRLKGKDYEAAVVPDPRCDLNRGNHSVRGGSQGRNLVTAKGEDRSTKERLVSPQIRCDDGELHDITWKVANEIVARLVAKSTDMEWKRGKGKGKTHVLCARKPEALGVKLYEYQFLENTYVATKLFFRAIGTPNVAYHDRPSVAGSSTGMKDAGFRPHAFAYEDVRHADVIFMVGSNPYENQSVFFMQNCTGKEMIVLDPRCTPTAQYAKDTGGIHLQPTKLGADSLVLYAIARALLETLPEDSIHARVARDLTDDDRRRLVGDCRTEQLRRASRAQGLNDFKTWLGVGDPRKTTYTLSNAAEVSGIKLEDLKRAVRWLSRRPTGADGFPLVATLYEKGLIWGFNYHNTAAVASLGLVLWRPEQPAPLTGRCGGHQKGWALAEGCVADFSPKEGAAVGDLHYPYEHAPDCYSDPHLVALRKRLKLDPKCDNLKLQHNLDTHVFGPDPIMEPEDIAEGRVRLKNGVETVAKPDVNLLWIVGGNYLGQTHNAQWKRAQLDRRRRCGESKGKPGLPKVSDLGNVDAIVEILAERFCNDGLVVIQQEIYANPTTEFADVLLPAAGWGEEDFVRYNAERRLRLYERFQDSPLHEADAERVRNSKRDPHECLSDPDLIQHSPKPDWMIFRDIARELIDFVTKGSAAAKEARAAFSWDDSAAIADEMAEKSNRKAMLEDLLPYAKAHGVPKGKYIHTLLGLDGSGEAPLLSTECGYSVPGGSPVLSNGVATNGVMLPAKTAESCTSDEPKLTGTLRQTPPGLVNFVRADWEDIEPWFESMQASDDEVTLTCGRVNHLWNNLYSSSRNDFIADRYPADMPGPILEVNPEWARNQEPPLENGVIVDVQVKSKDLNGSFIAVISRQDSVADGAAFAIFSYPVLKKNGFDFSGYANNVMHGYWDGINAIGALKYGRATIKPRTKKPSGIFRSKSGSGPSYETRNQIVALPITADLRPGVDDDGRWKWTRRLDWRMRELIVAKGLPRAFIHSGERRRASLLDPDSALRDLRHHWGSVFSMMLASMQWPPPRRPVDSEGEPVGRFDRWDGPDLDFVRTIWGRSLELEGETPIDGDEDPSLDLFIAWSEFLTDFDDLGNDRHHARTILARLRARDGVSDKLNSVLADLITTQGQLTSESHQLAYRDSELAEVTTVLWYTGAFLNDFGFPEDGEPGFGTMTDDHYRKGLLWRAAGIQPQGYSTSMERWEDSPASEEANS